MQLIPIEKIVSNWDSIRKAREAFLIEKGKTIDPNGLCHGLASKTFNSNTTALHVFTRGQDGGPTKQSPCPAHDAWLEHMAMT